MKLTYIITLLLFLLLTIYASDEPVKDSVSSDSSTTIKTNITGEPKEQQRWAFFPVLANTPETGFKFGGLVFHFLPLTDTSRETSSIDAFTFITTKGQFCFALTPNIFFMEDRYRFNAETIVKSWKNNFYGIGNDSDDDKELYKISMFTSDILLERRFVQNFILGGICRLQWEKIKAEDGGELSSGSIYGSDGGFHTGIGITGGYDSRDNYNAPHRGSYCTFEYAYHFGLDNDDRFHVEQLDLRQYFPTSERTTFAIRGYMRTTHSDVPFRFMSTPDGAFILRGIEKMRYSDKDLIALQSEFRFPIWWRFSGSVFSELAQVAPLVKKMKKDGFKSSLGLGIRFALNEKERLKIRADLAWVDDGIGFIIDVREAF